MATCGVCESDLTHVRHYPSKNDEWPGRWCNACYLRNRRNGSPTTIKYKAPKGASYLMVVKIAEMSNWGSECILWPWGSNKQGYGRVWYNDKVWTVPRLMMALLDEESPGIEFEVCHSCDVRLCFNPNHLSWCTHPENMRQAKERGRTRNGTKKR